MIEDRFGLAHSAGDGLATAAFETAVRALAGHRPAAGPALARAIEADPGHVAALALKGFAGVVLAREELVPGAAATAAEARGALMARNGGTPDEAALVDALEHAAAGRFRTAADLLDDAFADRPTTFLPFKISHSLRFMLGDRRGMLAASERMMRVWTEGLPAAGYLAGCHAFALEEHGHYGAAERIGRTAVALEPEDAWGLHAVSHVHEMTGDTAAGIAWLEETRASWSSCNNFSFHVAWHLALFRLETGDADGVLELYDEAVRPEQTDDFRDMANAVSLLWRLERRGVDVGDRWQALWAVAERRRADTTLVFAALHTLIALVAVGDRDGAATMLSALESRASGTGDQAAVAKDIGLPLARVIAGDLRTAPDGLVEALPRLGGSNAQRDLFMLALAEAAERQGRRAALSRIQSTRRQLKADDALIAAIAGRRPPVARSA